MSLSSLARWLRRPAVVVLASALLVAGLLRVSEVAAHADTSPGRIFEPASGDPPISSTAAQDAAVRALEDQLVDQLAQFHGLPNDDRIRGFARGELRAGLYLRFVEIIQKNANDRTASEQLVYGYLQQMVKGYRVAQATKARDEYHRWQAEVCTGYDPPGPFTYSGGCGGGFGTVTNPISNPPSFEEFQAYGTYLALQKVDDPFAGKLSQAAAQGIGLLAGVALAVAGGAAGAALAGIPAVASAFAGVVAPFALTASAFAAIGIAAVFATIILAVVVGVLQGIAVFQALEIPGKLDAAVNAAQSATPDLEGLVSTDDGKKAFFLNFFDNTLPENAGSITVPGFSDAGHGSWVVRNKNETTTTNEITVRVQGHHSFNYHQHVGIRDGWFVIDDPDGPPRYSTFLDYITWDGHYWRSTMLADGNYMHQRMVNGIPSKNCIAEDLPFADDVDCFVGPEIRYADVDFDDESVEFRAIKRNKPPTQPTITVGGLSREGRVTSVLGQATDPEGDALTFSWSVPLPCAPGPFFCGTDLNPTPVFTATGTDVDIPFPQDGVYPVTVTVKDGHGNTRTKTQNVTVSNVAPTVVLNDSSARVTTEGSGVTIAGVVDDFGPYDPLTLTIDWGDGTTTQKTWHVGSTFFDFNTGLPIPPRDGDEPFSFSHTYSDDPAGSNDVRTITVRVTDDDNALGIAGPVGVRINNENPATILALPAFKNEGETFTVAGTVQDPGDDGVQLDLRWGDGVTTIISMPKGGSRHWSTSHTYQDNGEYDIDLDLTDDDGGTFHVDSSIDVDNVDPTVAIAPLADVTVGEPVTAALSFADDGALDTRTASIDWGDGSAPVDLGTVGANASPGHTYLYADTYTVGAAVTDDDGGDGSASRSILVNRGATTTSAVTSSANPSTAGEPVTLRTTVSPVTFAGWSSPVPTGLVDFYDGLSYLGTGALDSAGQAQVTVSTLGVGNHSLTAYYNGSHNYLTSNSAATPLAQQVGYAVKPLYDVAKPTKAGGALQVKVSLAAANGTNLSSPGLTLTVVGVSPVVGGNPVPSGTFAWVPTLNKTGGYQYSFKTTSFKKGTYALRFTITGDPIVRSVPFVIS